MKNKIKQKKDWGDHGAMSSNPVNTEWEWRPHCNGSVTSIGNTKNKKQTKKGMGGGDQGAISSNQGNTEWGWHPHDTPCVLRNMNLRPPIT